MGNFVGNIFALIAIIGAASVGLVSLKASLLTFLAVAYGFWIILTLQASLTGGAIASDFREMLTDSEFRAFKKYNVHIRTAGAGHLISAFLNLLRLAGIVWAVLALLNEMYIEGGAAVAYFFLTGNLILRSDPVRYMERQALNGNDVARKEIGLINSVVEKREYYLSDIMDEDEHAVDPPISSIELLEEFKKEISDWPADQAKIALELILAVTEGNKTEYERLYPQLTFSQFQQVTAHLKKLEGSEPAHDFDDDIDEDDYDEDDEDVSDVPDFKPTEYEDYHEVLDEVVGRLKEPMSAICADEDSASVMIKCELLGYATAYQAKLLIGAEMHPSSWNSFKTSVEYRIFPLLDEKPKLSGSNVLPDGGIELVSYASKYNTYMDELEKIIDENTNPGSVDLPPLLRYFSIDPDNIGSENLKLLLGQLNGSVGLCARVVVPDVQSVFS